MRLENSPFQGPAKLLCGLFLAGLLLIGLPALGAPPIKVTSAVPDTGEQGTVSLVVRIAGDNFGNDSKVAFYVTGTSDPGGIVVKNVHWVNAKALDATIDIDPAAQTEAKFDVQVLSNGRTGKGTELFKVVAKPVNGDTTPPGEVYDLTAPETGIGLSSAMLTWIAPADDGFDASSGPVTGIRIGFRSAGPFTTELWDNNDFISGFGLLPSDSSPWPNPGDTVTARVNELSPGTTYWVAVRSYDDMENWSAISASSHVSFTTDEFPATDWVVEEIDGCVAPNFYYSAWDLDIEFDLDGRPALLYGLNCEGQGAPRGLFLARSSESGWSREALPFTTRDPRLEDLAFDPVTGAVTLAHVDGNGKLAFYSQVGSSWPSETVERSQAGALSLAYFDGRPAIAYKRGTSIRVAQRIGSRWTTTQFQLASGVTSSYAPLQLAFDASGNPAVAFGEDRDGNYSAEVVKMAIWDAGGWGIERIDEVDPGWTLSNVMVAWDSTRGDFTVAHAGDGRTGPWQTYESRLRVCDRSGANGWSCATVGGSEEEQARLIGLTCSATGTTSVAYASDWSVLMLTERPAGATEWAAPEYLTWGGYEGSLAIDPATGRLAVSSPTMSHREKPPTIRMVRKQP